MGINKQMMQQHGHKASHAPSLQSMNQRPHGHSAPMNLAQKGGAKGHSSLQNMNTWVTPGGGVVSDGLGWNNWGGFGAGAWGAAPYTGFGYGAYGAEWAAPYAGAWGLNDWATPYAGYYGAWDAPAAWAGAEAAAWDVNAFAAPYGAWNNWAYGAAPYGGLWW